MFGHFLFEVWGVFVGDFRGFAVRDVQFRLNGLIDRNPIRGLLFHLPNASEIALASQNLYV